MTDQELIVAVNEVFTESFEVPAEKLVPGAHIFNDLGFDSLDVVDLIVAIQKKFGVRLRNDERIRTVRTMGDLYNYLILVKQEEAGAAPK